jgi:hypothetical protein
MMALIVPVPPQFASSCIALTMRSMQRARKRSCLATEVAGGAAAPFNREFLFICGHSLPTARCLRLPIRLRPDRSGEACLRTCARPAHNIMTLFCACWLRVLSCAASSQGPLRGARRRAFNKRFLFDLAEDWQQHGREVFKRVRRESPAAYLKVCAMLVPRELQVEHSGGVKAMTDEQIERGIELIKQMLAEREAGAITKVIEREAKPSRACRGLMYLLTGP